MQQCPLDDPKSANMDLSELEAKVDLLIARCHALSEENRELRERERSWLSERADLQAQHQVAQAKIESMIGRVGTPGEPR